MKPYYRRIFLIFLFRERWEAAGEWTSNRKAADVIAKEFRAAGVRTRTVAVEIPIVAFPKRACRAE